jgi:hypothetical protein
VTRGSGALKINNHSNFKHNKLGVTMGEAQKPPDPSFVLRGASCACGRVGMRGWVKVLNGQVAGAETGHDAIVHSLAFCRGMLCSMWPLQCNVLTGTGKLTHRTCMPTRTAGHGGLLAAADDDGVVRVWDTATRRASCEFQASACSVLAVQVAPAAACRDLRHP